MAEYINRQLLEDIYDLLKGTALSHREEMRSSDSFTALAAGFAKDAYKNLHNYLANKRMEWDPETSTIKIGKNIVLRLEINGEQKKST